MNSALVYTPYQSIRLIVLPIKKQKKCGLLVEWNRFFFLNLAKAYWKSIRCGSGFSVESEIKTVPL